MLELRAGSLLATFAPEASMVCSSLTADGEELLGLRDGLDAYVERGTTMGIPLLHPWANRLFGWRYGEVELEAGAPGVQDDGEGNPIHGLLHGRGHFEVVAHDETSLRARLNFGAGVDGAGLLRSFPFPHVLEVAVHLRPDGMTHRTTLTATGVVGVPVSFGWHPYFAAPEPLEPVDEPSDAREHTVGRVTVELQDGYETAHLFVPPSGDICAFEPMTAPVDALRTGRGLRHVAPGQTFTAAFRLRVAPAPSGRP